MLRPEDAAEILAWGALPADGVAVSIALASEVWAVVDRDSGAAVGVWGVRTEESGVGHPWLLSGVPMLKHRKAILRFGKGMIQRWHRAFPLLVTWSWLGASRNHAWLHHLGFTPIEIIPVGAQSALAYTFVRINNG